MIVWSYWLLHLEAQTSELFISSYPMRNSKANGITSNLSKSFQNNLLVLKKRTQTK